MIEMVLHDKVLNYVLVPKDGELLLKRRLLLLSDVEFKQTCVNVVHNFEEVVAEGNVDPRTVDELVKCVIV